MYGSFNIAIIYGLELEIRKICAKNCSLLEPEK